MIESMTGYGSGEYADHGVRITAEIRSVNNRFAEISVKLPRQFSSRELEAREIIRSKLQRGKITATIQLERLSPLDRPLEIREDVVKIYAGMLEKIRAAAGIAEPVKLDHILRFPEIFESGEDSSGLLEREWGVIGTALNMAVESLREMRRKEGAELCKDFISRIENINSVLDEIEQISKQSVAQTREKLREKVREILEDESKISKERLEVEIALISDKLDITEECVRFRSHNKFFVEALESDEQGVGRKLNFLLQEQSREANTIASKSQNSDISQQIVHLKEELEKIREQVQNIE
ncbi:MAG: YicC family protein [Chlorobiales bacterium]|nr:YicC family protein [Chlorobiales bacterium]